jgi:hypothetical protein
MNVDIHLASLEQWLMRDKGPSLVILNIPEPRCGRELNACLLDDIANGILDSRVNRVQTDRIEYLKPEQ